MKAKVEEEIENAKIAQLARIFSDPTRVGIINLLLRKGEATTMDIATRLGSPQPRVSSHLAILLKGGLVSVSKIGRQRNYIADSGGIGRILANLSSLAVNLESQDISLPKTTRWLAKPSLSIRQCRTCYDHLAGTAGVELLDELLSLGWVHGLKNRGGKKGSRILYKLSDSGSKSLRERGVDIEGTMRSKRAFACGCLDWTEQRPHLGGSLGRGILQSLFSNKVIERIEGTRALKQLEPISDWIRGRRRSS